MSGVEGYLRLLVQCDKEAKITAQAVTGVPTLFSTALVGGNTRRRISVYNNSNVGSGECFYGFSATMSPSGESIPIPNDSMIDIPISTDITLYLCASSGEVGDLRVEEMA